MRINPVLSIIILLFLLVACVVDAKIYKWIDKSGVTHFSDSKPENLMVEEIEIKSFTTVSFEQSPEAIEYKPLKRVKNRIVKIYTTQRCGYCKKAKNYFKSKNIRYIEYDIDVNKTARKKYDKMGAKGVPVILVGNRRMNGFSIIGFEDFYQK